MRFFAAATLIALVLSACAQSPELARPTESPIDTPLEVATITPETPSPALSPTPAPTEVATPAPTAPPRPTTRKAGEQMYVYYFEARRQFPIFPPTPQIDFDEPAGENGNSWFRGLNSSGQPIFAVREDYLMTPRTAYHEIGHAYEALLLQKDPNRDVMGKFWAYRSFPGTWQDAMKSSAAQPSFMAQWLSNPHEIWAENFSVGMVGVGGDFNPVAMKAFFKTLLPAP